MAIPIRLHWIMKGRFSQLCFWAEPNVNIKPMWHLSTVNAVSTHGAWALCPYRNKHYLLRIIIQLCMVFLRKKAALGVTTSMQVGGAQCSQLCFWAKPNPRIKPTWHLWIVNTVRTHGAWALCPYHNKHYLLEIFIQLRMVFLRKKAALAHEDVFLLETLMMG